MGLITAICAVIDDAKINGDRDTDEYAAEIMEAVIAHTCKTCKVEEG